MGKDEEGPGAGPRTRSRVAGDSWDKGAEGEERVAAVLDEWARSHGSTTLHSLVRPPAKGDIDHVAIGPAGVFVIDSKAWSGEVRLRPSGTWTGRYGHARELDAIAGQGRQVRAALDAAGLFGVPVQAVLCLANENDGSARHGLEPVREVLVGHPRSVAAAVAGEGPLGRAEVARARAAIAAAFVLRGEGVLPAAEPTPPAVVGAALPATRTRGGTTAAKRPRFLAEVVVLCLALLVLLVTLGTLTDTKRSPGQLSRVELRVLLPGLEERAAAAAGGAVRGPAIDRTARRFQVRYRRGACRVRLSVDRATVRRASEPPLVTSGRC